MEETGHLKCMQIRVPEVITTGGEVVDVEMAECYAVVLCDKKCFQLGVPDVGASFLFEANMILGPCAVAIQDSVF